MNDPHIGDAGADGADSAVGNARATAGSRTAGTAPVAGAVTVDAAVAGRLESSRVWFLATSSLGGFLVTFMGSSVNIALPLIEEEFHVSAVMLSWISLAYILVSGAVLLPAGRIADLHGRVRLFTWGMAIFSVLSFASAFAPSAGVLLALRVLHGVGLAFGAATSMALVVMAYPPEKRGRALGLTVACVYLGLTLGPVLGGLIVHNLGWRALFLIVGAAAVLNVALPLWKLRGLDQKQPKTGRFDLLGSLIYAMALTAVMLGFSLVPGVAGWILIPAGIAGVALFLWWETHADDPLLNVRLLRKSRVFAFANVATFMQYSASSTMVFLLSLYLQYNRGLNAQTAGFVLVGGAFVQAALSPLAGRLTDRANAQHVAASGTAICVAGLLGLSFVTTTSPYWYVITMVCLVGAGVAFFSTPNTHAIMGSVEPQWIGVASATVATMRHAGNSVSQGLATLVLAMVVGQQAIRPEDYPQVLTSVRICFLIFTVVCVLAIGASLVGPHRRSK
jgi:MFS family permease